MPSKRRPSRPPRFLTTIEAASRLYLAPKTLRNWRDLGEGPSYVKVGPLMQSPCFYDAADIEALGILKHYKPVIATRVNMIFVAEEAL